MTPVATNMMFHITKSPSYYVCLQCTAKAGDYYILTGNRKDPSEMIPLCDACYYNQSRTQKEKTIL